GQGTTYFARLSHHTTKQKCHIMSQCRSPLKLTYSVGLNTHLMKSLLCAFLADSSTCVHGTPCGGHTGCVWESQWCDGVVDCPAGQDEAHCVRLHGTSFLLQIFSTQTKQWRTVCSHGWTAQLGQASCTNAPFKNMTTHCISTFVFCTFCSNYCPNNTVVTLRCTDCTGGVNSSRASRGQQASLGAWPWQVSLQLAGSHRCGGAIISPNWIVTAAHCAHMTSNPGDWSVYAGLVEPLGIHFNPAHAVGHVVAHERFDRVTYRNDIALMRLTSSNIGPVCLPNVGLNISAPLNVWTTGYALTHLLICCASDSPYLVEAQVSLVDVAGCNSSTAYKGLISKEMLCSKGAQTGSDACKTDSGGPLVWQRDGSWWLVGENIWPESCIDLNKPGVYNNITYFLDWIYHQMKVTK
uniref:Transmembrane serine protease 2 n=1 Tax=Hippocampus comes TaxID=109280 RepID=A0A3Q3DXM5_HIPCM